MFESLFQVYLHLGHHIAQSDRTGTTFTCKAVHKHASISLFAGVYEFASILEVLFNVAHRRIQKWQLQIGVLIRKSLANPTGTRQNVSDPMLLLFSTVECCTHGALEQKVVC